MRRLCLILACALVLPALAAGGSASADTPCWKSVIADWSKDRTIGGRYPAACFRQAMQNAPTDLKIYSSLEDDLQAALRARSSRRLSGVHVSTAALEGTGHSSPASLLIGLLAGLAGLVLTCAAVAAIVRRRGTRLR
jgi:hypothetical protein